MKRSQFFLLISFLKYFKINVSQISSCFLSYKFPNSSITLRSRVKSVWSISCSDIVRDGSVKDFSKDELLTLSSNTPQQLETCLFLLGRDEIETGQAQVIWTAMKSVYGSVVDIPEESIKQLGWIISGIPVEDFYNISIPDIDVVSVFGYYRNLSIQQLSALKKSTENQWGRKTPEQLTSYDLAALRQILCAFNESEIAAIHPDSYRDAASELATLHKCPKPILTQLVYLATDETAFGIQTKWNAIHVTSIGCVMAGLSAANGIPPESMEGITSHIVQCLPSSFLKTMTESQLQHFTTNAASAFSQSQREALSSDQRYALDQAITGVQYTKRSSANALFAGDLFLVSVVTMFIKYVCNKTLDA